MGIIKVSPGLSAAKKLLRRSRFLILARSLSQNTSNGSCWLPLKTKVLEVRTRGKGFQGRASASRKALNSRPIGQATSCGRSISAWGQHAPSGALMVLCVSVSLSLIFTIDVRILLYDALTFPRRYVPRDIRRPFPETLPWEHPKVQRLCRVG